MTAISGNILKEVWILSFGDLLVAGVKCDLNGQ